MAATDPPEAGSFPTLARALAGRRRIPAVLWDASAEARALTEAARAESRAILDAARKGAEEIRTAAAARGRDEGSSAVAELHARALVDRDRLLEAARHDLLELAFGIAARVIGPIVERHPELVVETAARALAASRGRLELVLRACPADAEALHAAEPRLSALASGSPAVRVVEDASLARGGVILETELGRVDASVEAQLAALRRAIAERGVAA